MFRATAAAFTGSGFAPASGGQTTAAIVSPAASRPRRTSSANAAWPTRRMCMRILGLQVRGEEPLQTFPGVVRGSFLIRGSLIAEESVVGAGVDHDLHLLAVLSRFGLQPLDAVERDEGVLLAEEREHGATELLR